jgi:hypothetical protein
MRRVWRAYVRVGNIKEGALRRLMPSRMNFVHYSWPLRPAVCPCDIDFCEFLQTRAVRRKSVFHFGTGGHHVVGLYNHSAGLENDVLGLTLAPPEHAKYVRQVIRDPALGRHYKVLFADLYSLSEQCLPDVDIVTLFHLGEFSDAGNPGRRMDDAGVLRLFLSKSFAGGLICFYPGSYGYRKSLPLIERAVAEGKLSFVEAYKSLSIFRVPGAACGAAESPSE